MKSILKKLTIAIPTYNREEQLKNQLLRLSSQNLSRVVEILVIDNNSNYDVTKLILSLNCDKIRLIKNNLNVGMSTNLQTPFLHVNSGWLWLLSDDDIVLENSIDIIINEIQSSNEKVSWIKFNINPKQRFENIFTQNLEEFIDYYFSLDGPLKRGDLVFYSNNVFNIDILKKYITKSFECSYTYIGYLFPALHALNDSNGTTIFCDSNIVCYSPPSDGGYSYNKVGLGLSTVSHHNFNLSKNYKNKLNNLLLSIPYQWFILSFLKGGYFDKQAFNLINKNGYSIFLPFKDKIIIRLFKIYFSFFSSSFLNKLILKLFNIKNR